MKKLFTLFAFLACFLGAKAEWVEDYSIDYSTYSGFPFYVMGYVPEWFGGVMTDFGAMYKYVQVTDDATETSSVIVKTQNGVEYYKIELESPAWHQYFIADGIPTEIGQSYTVKALVKASEAVTINVNMGWGWGDGEQASASVSIPAGSDFQEVEWEYGEINGSSCNLVAQPGSSTATIEWKSLTVSHNAKDVRPVEWIELLQNGDAEKSWAEMGLADVAFNDMENNYKICAWGKEKGVNLNDDGGWDPFPATIEVENGTSNHVFVVHGKEATTEGDASAWDNQFWIQCPQEMKAGTQVKLKFRYKASKNVTVATQTHYQQPSNYLIWHCAGDISFTEEWQEYNQTVTFADDMGGGWSCAFQLNQNDKDAIDFYFDDLSWQIMKLDEGYFVAGSNSNTGIAYDFDNAIEFTQDGDLLVATVGTAGKQNTWVNEVMISTVRGYDASFRGATIKPSGTVDGDPDTWLDYTASSNAKIKLPAAGVWTISLYPAGAQMNFVKVEGEENKQPIEINPNPFVVVVNGVERDDLSDQTNQQTGEVTVRENEGGTGETWDNQFFIQANRPLDAGEETVIQFKYKASKEAKVTTQCHVLPGDYIHWSAIGDVNFTTEEQTFEKDFIIPAEANSGDRKMQSIAFNMAEIKEACDYTIWDVVWKLKDNTESLINQEGGQNYYIKVGAGTNPEVADGIEEIVSDGTVKGNGAIYNIAGQRVDSSYKGVVIKNGKKYIAK